MARTTNIAAISAIIGRHPVLEVAALTARRPQHVDFEQPDLPSVPLTPLVHRGITPPIFPIFLSLPPPLRRRWFRMPAASSARHRNPGLPAAYSGFAARSRA